MATLPYFDLLLEGRKQQDPAARAFEYFVHWGYWENPGEATLDDREFKRAMERLNDQVLLAADLKNGQSVLDCGCGFGGTLAAINRIHRGMRLTGVNIDPRQIAVAKQQVKAENENEISFVEGDACRLPFPNGTFDRVLAVECIFHFPSRAHFLKEARRVLKPNGRLALSDFVPWKIGGARWPGAGWLEHQVTRGYGTLGDGWKEGDYKNMASAAGLEIESNVDITRQTLPTYPVLIDLIRRGGMGGKNSIMLWPTRLLQWLSVPGLLRYRVVSFRTSESR